MFQDNPLLAQLKQQLHAQTPRVEGVVKGTEKGFGFLEVDGQKSYFIPPPHMKKVMHGDRIIASLQTEKEKEIAQPETLVEPFLSRFVGRVQKKDDRLFIVPDHPLLKDAIQCRVGPQLDHSFNVGDWAVAEMRRHPLKGDRAFQADLTQFITFGDDHLAPWWVTLARHNLEREAPQQPADLVAQSPAPLEDLTALPFVTIDSASTEDMDDALYVQDNGDGTLQLIIAIADPTAYVAQDSELDVIARKRAFTNYLPGFNIPMLPRDLSENLCSLRPNEQRQVLACRVNLAADGAMAKDIEFFAALIERKRWTLSRPGILELTHNHGTEHLAETPYHNGNAEPRGFGHLCVTVPDIHAACARFTELDVNFQKRLDEGRMNYVAFIKDPDGYWIELLQPTPL